MRPSSILAMLALASASVAGTVPCVDMSPSALNHVPRDVVKIQKHSIAGRQTTTSELNHVPRSVVNEQTPAFTNPAPANDGLNHVPRSFVTIQVRSATDYATATASAAAESSYFPGPLDIPNVIEVPVKLAAAAEEKPKPKKKCTFWELLIDWGNKKCYNGYDIVPPQLDPNGWTPPE